MNITGNVLNLAFRSGDMAVIACARLAHATGMLKLYQPIPDLNLAMDSLRPRLQMRLNSIRDQLPPGTHDGLDIGCNIGYYAFELAKDGHRIMGVEGGPANFAILSAARRKLQVSRIVPVQWTLTPENIGLLPQVDFTIFMSVFHHWCLAYGAETALEMLSVIISRTRNVLFFESAQYDETSDRYKDILPDRGTSDSEQWWHSYFSSKKISEVRTIYKQGRSLMAVRP